MVFMARPLLSRKFDGAVITVYMLVPGPLWLCAEITAYMLVCITVLKLVC